MPKNSITPISPVETVALRALALAHDAFASAAEAAEEAPAPAPAPSIPPLGLQSLRGTDDKWAPARDRGGSTGGERAQGCVRISRGRQCLGHLHRALSVSYTPYA